VIYPPAGRLVLNEFNQARRVERPHGTAAAFPRYDLVPEGTSLRPACQVNQRSFWIVECIRVMWDMDATHSEEFRNPVAVRKQPSFNRADDEPEAHVRCRVAKPSLDARWCAFAIPVEIDENDPGGMLCCPVVAVERPEQRRLSTSPVDIAQSQVGLADDLMKHRFVEITLHCAGHDRQRSVPEQCKLLWPWRASLGQENIGKRHATVDQRLCLGKIGRRLDASALGVRLEQQNFVQSNSFVAQ
jgi:hypothetical protein